MPEEAFAPGITTADLPCKKDGPVGSGRFINLRLVLFSDSTLLSKFECYFTLASTLQPLVKTGGAGADSPFGCLLRASTAYHNAEGSLATKQAVATRVVVDKTLAACLPRLRHSPDTNFVLLPAVPSPRCSPATAVAREPTGAGNPCRSPGRHGHWQ